MAILVLLSTISWTVAKHRCMGRVIDVAFFHEATHCGMPSLSLEEEGSMELPGCCSNESFTITGQEDLQTSWDDLSLASQIWVLVSVQTYGEVGLTPSETAVRNRWYPPPLLTHDLRLLHEVFLI